VTSNKKVKRQGQLREGAARHNAIELLAVDLEDTVPPSPGEPDHVPLVQRNRFIAPETTEHRLQACFAINTIYDTVYLKRSQKLTGTQLSLIHGVKQKI